MKNLINIKILILALPLWMVMGCDKYLEESPDNRVDLSTLEKAAQTLTSAYPSGSYNFTEWMTDNVTFTYGTIKLPEHNEAYTWQDITSVEQDTPADFWNTSYEAIAHANEVLGVIDDIPGEESQRNAVKGEALLVRAYNHFMLVNLFGKHYNSFSSIRDLGVPYIEEPEKNFIVQYERNTVEEVYQKVEADLLKGIELVNDNFYANSGKYHFTRDAALAFASRFYLFKGDLNNCINFSTQLLAGSPGTYVKDIPQLLQTRVNTEDFLRLYNSPNDNSNLLLIRKVANFHVNVGHWPTSQIMNSIYNANPFRADDIRADAYFQRGENGLGIPKFEFLFERTSLTSNVGYNYTITVAFRGEEVLLNRAECYVAQNRLDEAIADLQVLTARRYEGNNTLDMQALRDYYGAGDDQTYDQEIVYDYIITERRKEFMHEGLRWFDIKRFQLPVVHINEDAATQTQLASDDVRKVLQIPQAAIDVGGLKPNPR